MRISLPSTLKYMLSFKELWWFKEAFIQSRNIDFDAIAILESRITNIGY